MTELVSSNDRASHSIEDETRASRLYHCGGDRSGQSDPAILDSLGACQALLRVVLDRVLLVRRDGEILDAQFHQAQDSGIRNLIGKNFRDVLSPAASNQAGYYLEQVFGTGQVQQFVFTSEVGGEFGEYDARLSQCGDDHVLVLVRDITFEKLREKEIVEIANREQLRIGQDLHDGLGQQLTGISFLSRALEQKLTARGLSEAADAAEICRLVVQTLSQTRNLARGLFPVELEGNGLISALKHLGQEVEKLFNISCVVECAEGLIIQDRGTSNHLFRLAQEAINNSVKHGKARRVSVSLECLNGSASLSIRDDGIGFRDNTVPGQGLGLRIMNYRAQKVGGVLDVRSVPSGGVHIRCTFPYTAPSTKGPEPSPDQ